ncbi:nuclear transcription factor Y subunit gamma, transcript variant X2 [Ictidomys tridecemlineatus]|uniref:nuclear transcription factor Y subunit gamma isoform X1 n=2 Tax=Ictidomys tridecemlineatus TaxID=43179 RepID=UPI00068121B0|nr:nuclear transcription factor Y subunit gamma isoform X1 [Ictidomys tridecemlineatus]KAG3282876.1 nuclear transcription factor Y subunit gamma, transcript variant X1 [Ictidomys tridecemlineatus]KAG3282877.1 nuclear transcription factor Y subunit gamma, transcript variant X2 [Ictidomys tridecemlineatus]
MPSFVPIFLSKSKHHKAIYSLQFISVCSQASTTARLCIPWKGPDHKNPQIFFRFNSSSTLPNSRETPVDSASAHCTTLGVEAPREGEGKRGDGANGVAAILFVPPLRARSVLRDARFPLPSTVPGPLHCPTPQERGGGSCSSQDCAAGTFIEMSTEGGFGGTSSSDAQQSLQSFWPRVMEEIRNLTVKDFRVQELPLARIKKIMKLDEDVKMISAEAPVLFAKAAQIFITELTLRAWIHTEDNKRRTLQRNDIAMAITKFDQFDFLIDIVPRDELKPPKRQEEVRQSVTPAEPVQYYFTLAQQPTAVQVQGQQQGQQTTSSTTTIQPGQIIIAQPQQGQTTPVTMQVGEGQQVQIVQAQPQGQAQQAQSGTGQTMQVMQQIITNTGEIQQIPVQLNAGQLQYIRLAQPVSGTQVVQGQIQTLATNAQQITQTEVQQGQQQFSQFTDGQRNSVQQAQGSELTGEAEPREVKATGNATPCTSSLPTTHTPSHQADASCVCCSLPQQSATPAPPSDALQWVVVEVSGAPNQLEAHRELHAPLPGVTSLSPLHPSQQLYQIQQVTMPAGQDLAQPMFIQSANQPSDGQAPQVTGD